MKRETTVHHPLADIHIKSIEHHQIKKIGGVIKKTLDDYLNDPSVTHIPASVIHEDTKARLGDFYQTPGYYLWIYRHRADFTQVMLAKKLGIRQHHLSEMEHNKRSIGKELAKKLADVLNCDYRKFL